MAETTDSAGQAPAALTQQAQGNADVPHRLGDLLGRSAEVYLSTEEAAQYVNRPSREALIRWCHRHHVPLRRPDGGRTYVVKKGDLDFALRVRR